MYDYDPLTGLVYGKKGKPIGSIKKTGYLAARIYGKETKLHRFIFEFMNVPIPLGMVVDHINHIKTDNRWSNLRLVTRRGNSTNASRSKNNTSNTTGVCWSKHHEKWIATINTGSKRVWIGVYTDRLQAVRARREAEIQYGYHENHGSEK